VSRPPAFNEFSSPAPQAVIGASDDREREVLRPSVAGWTVAARGRLRRLVEPSRGGECNGLVRRIGAAEAGACLCALHAHARRPGLPRPQPAGGLPALPSPRGKQIAVAADGACKHLLSSGGTANPQQRQQKILFGVKVAQCLRTHGYPNMPDPTGLGSNQLPLGIDPNSPRFQTAENGCEKQARKELGLP
jgi:hypothetical protein